MQLTSRKILAISIIISLALGFAGGFIYSGYGRTESFSATLRQLVGMDSGKPADVDFALFWQVYNSLKEKYVDAKGIDANKILYGAISGMVSGVGDPYTVFFEPQLSKKFEEEISGSFSGVGMEVGKRDGILTVIAPLKNTPASKAGILAGDKILKIDELETTDMTVEEAVNHIRGPKGSKVSLFMSRYGKARNVDLIRQNIKIPAVDWKIIGGKTAYIGIYSFNQNVDSEFQKTVQDILKTSADRIIIDLRNNPGGLLDSSVYIAGWLLDNGSVVTIEQFGDGTKNEFKTNGNGLLKKFKTVILQNGGSASASEILAGALHDNRGITIIGEKSYGKGSVQELIKFSDQSSLKVTIAKWLTPAGVSISDTGISADVEVKISEQDIIDGKVNMGEVGKDPQLDRAIEIINNL